jgi:hypothetical protein
MNVDGLKKALPLCFESDITLLLVGSHGIGKSQGVRQAIEGQGLGKVWDFRLGQMADSGDIIGLLDVDSKKEYSSFKIPERIYQVIDYSKNNPDKYGVMFFDEMNRTTKDILQAIFQIVLDHELNGIKFPKNMRAVAAINPATEDYSVLDFNDKAFSDRFCQVKFEPSTKDWLNYAKTKNVDSTIINFINENNEMLKKETNDFKLEIDYTPRSWMAVDRLLKKFPPKDIFQELLIGIVGLEAAGMYLDHLNKTGEKLEALDILNDFKKYKDIIKRHSSNEKNREDILKILNDGIVSELSKIKVMSKKYEENLVSYIEVIPKNLGYALVLELYNVECFSSTENDEKFGLSGNPDIPVEKNIENCKRLIEHFKNWKKEEVGSSNE